MKPRIGLTPTPTMDDGRPVDQLNRAYSAAVTRAGGIPFILPVLDPAEADDALAGLDGLLLSGGGDVDPARYGAEAAPEVAGIKIERDAWELALVEAASRRALPLLGICRGSQLLNVAVGGTLVQHLPSITDLAHCVRERDFEEVHPVQVEPGSRLEAVVGAGELWVNSLHHQAVETVGAGLRVVAWAPDGVAEAVEGTGPWAVLGVQWHPELLAERLPVQAALFEWLVVQAGSPVQAVPDAA